MGSGLGALGFASGSAVLTPVPGTRAVYTLTSVPPWVGYFSHPCDRDRDRATWGEDISILAKGKQPSMAGQTVQQDQLVALVGEPGSGSRYRAGSRAGL